MYRVEDKRGRFIEVTAITRGSQDVSGIQIVRITLRISLNKNGSNLPCDAEFTVERFVDSDPIRFDSEVSGAIADLLHELDSLCGFVRMNSHVQD